ncbi:hypothetical protein ACUOA9_21265, partial [Escherichia sp. HC-TM1]
MSTGLRFTLEVDGLPPDASAVWRVVSTFCCALTASAS